MLLLLMLYGIPVARIAGYRITMLNRSRKNPALRTTCHRSALSALGIREFREILFKPYRNIYRVERRTVYIYLIADGRRDMQTLLSRRMLTD